MFELRKIISKSFCVVPKNDIGLSAAGDSPPPRLADLSWAYLFEYPKAVFRRPNQERRTSDAVGNGSKKKSAFLPSRTTIPDVRRKFKIFDTHSAAINLYGRSEI